MITGIYKNYREIALRSNDILYKFRISLRVVVVRYNNSWYKSTISIENLL